jgi:hypothetical protein
MLDEKMDRIKEHLRLTTCVTVCVMQDRSAQDLSLLRAGRDEIGREASDIAGMSSRP